MNYLSGMLLLYFHLLRGNNCSLRQVRPSSWKGCQTRIEGECSCITGSSSLSLCQLTPHLTAYIIKLMISYFDFSHKFCLPKHAEIADRVMQTLAIHLCHCVTSHRTFYGEIDDQSFIAKMFYPDQFRLSAGHFYGVRVQFECSGINVTRITVNFCCISVCLNNCRYFYVSVIN